MLDLRLDHDDDGGVAQDAVRPLEQEEVGEASDGRAQVRGHRARPGLGERPPVPAADVPPEGELLDTEAGAEDDRVHLVLATVRGDDAGGRDARDRIRDDLDVRRRDGGEVVVGDEDALAAERVVRRELPTQLRVRHAPREVAQRDALDELRDARVEEREAAQLAAAVDARAGEQLQSGGRAEQPALERTKGSVVPGEDPGRGPLEDRERLHPRLDGGDELDCRRARADDGDPLAAEVVVVVPGSGVKGLPLEALETGEGRDARLAQRADGADEDVGRERTTGGAEVPPRRDGVPGGLFHGVMKAEVRAHAEAVRARLEVRADLGLGRVRAAPVGVPCERERVEVRFDVARAPGVGVVAPHPSELPGALEDEEVLLSTLLQADCRPEAAEAAACDGDVDVARRGGAHGGPTRERSSPAVKT